jgi:carotenoid cleavage dioxygenase
MHGIEYQYLASRKNSVPAREALAMSMTRRDFLQTVAAGSLLTLGPAPSWAEADDAPKKLSWPKSPFLENNFAPVQEEITADALPVAGKLPAELDGLFVRNGPNPQFPPRGNYHWFDGDGMLHGVRIRGGKASYRNRYVRTAGWGEERQAGEALYRGLTDPPTVQARTAKMTMKNTANTALVWHDGKLLALWEGGDPHAIKVPGLETVGPFNFNGKLKHPFTAHPKVDTVTGEMCFFGYRLFTAPYVFYGVINFLGELVHSVPVDVHRPVMMHDFAITERYSIFMDLPETFSMDRAVRGQMPFRFEPEFGARFGVLPRMGQRNEIKWFQAKPCYVFHTLNAYEEGDEVVLLACRMNEFPGSLMGGNVNSEGGIVKQASPFLYRWRFNLKTGKTTEGPLDDVASEFPRIHDGYLGRKTRYGYAAREGGDMLSGLIKYDLAKGTSETHEYGKGRMGGEGVFVPRPGGSEEDDGWLVNYVYDQATNRSEMVVVDARDFQAKPVARVMLPARVPYGFHGTWIPGTELDKL